MHAKIITIVISLFMIQSACLFGQSIVHNIGQPYIDANFNRTDHVDGMTPNRLNNLKGEIESLTQFDYSAELIDNELKNTRLTSGTPTFTLIFNKDKKIEEEWSYRDEQNISHKNYYTDYKRNLIDSSVFWNKEREIFSKTVYSYQNLLCTSKIETRNGKAEQLINEVSQSEDSTVVVSKWFVDHYVNSCLIKSIQKTGRRYYEFSYYETGQLKEKRTYDKERIESIESFHRNGNLEYMLFNRYVNDSLEYSRERFLKYDSENRKINEREVRIESEKTEVSNDHYIYKDNLLVKLIKEDESGQQRVTGRFEYDTLGNMTMKFLYGSTDKFVYKYDEYENWIQRVHTNGDRIISLTERKIKYW